MIEAQKLNVQARILGDKILGSFFIDGNLTTEKYEKYAARLCRQYKLSLVQPLTIFDFNNMGYRLTTQAR